MTSKEFLEALQTGTLRVAHKENGEWIVNADVKQNILQVFKESTMIDMGEKIPAYAGFPDKDLLTPQLFTPEQGIRMVPGGSSVRAGAHIAKGVIIMPPSYINIGAFIDEGTMVDSHVLVGSCAQIGKHVHLSTAVQIGGVLEPIGNRPVIIEDNAFLGAGVIVTEGVIVRERAVLAPGVSLSAAVPIYDMVNQKIIKGEIPAKAVVVPGNRPVSNEWGKSLGLSVNCAVIIKYRDEKTETSVVLEEALR